MTQVGQRGTPGKPRVLLVDDDQDMLAMLVRLVGRKCDCEIETAASGEAAWELVARWRPDVIVTDIKMPGLDGMELLARVKEQDPAISVIVMTGYGTVELAVAALKKGAYDFIEKPFDKDHIVLTLHRCLERVRLLRENRELHERLEGKMPVGFVGRSPRLQEVFERIKKVADTDVTVLIRGESGTGKELAARALHSLSSRAAKPLITVNCPALPEQILESELFGYVKGAFTGAEQDKKGLFIEANGSTILLDEIGDIPLNLQTKLLRVLQEKEVMPLGQNRSIKVDVRVLASTNQNLEEKILRGSFREDLFYRLNVVTLVMPPLAERPEDIPLLAEYFLERYCQEYDRQGVTFTPEAMAYLIRHRWKGNVRELQNLVKRAVLLASGRRIDKADLASEAGEASGMPATLPDFTGLSYHDAKQELVSRFSEAYLSKALEGSGGNVTAAAQASGMNRQAFQRLMRRYGLQAESFRSSSQ